LLSEIVVNLKDATNSVSVTDFFDYNLILKMKPLTKHQNSQIRIGTQGWNYNDWITKIGDETVFFPNGTRTTEMLEFYSKIYDAIEVDSTFYAIPASSAIDNWYKKTPKNFIFSLKMPQEISHVLEFGEESFPLLEMFCDRVKNLREKLGIVLIQTPPGFEASKENAKNLRNFLSKLPREIRFSIEFRNRDWLVDWTFQELTKHNVSICLVEGNWIPRQLFFDAPETADFAYIRFMGERDLESFDKIVRPQDTNLALWKEKLETLQAKQIYVTFSNFYEGLATASVNKLKHLFNQYVIDAKDFETQTSLF
jgi:uncharacterized protein YecE (DUF72 family)